MKILFAILFFYNMTAFATSENPEEWFHVYYPYSTSHPYEENHEESVRFEKPEASKMAIFFSKFETEYKYDKVYFENDSGEILKVYSGNLGANWYSHVIDGNTVTIRFVSDHTKTKYGFDILGYAYK